MPIPVPVPSPGAHPNNTVTLKNINRACNTPNSPVPHRSNAAVSQPSSSRHARGDHWSGDEPPRKRRGGVVCGKDEGVWVGGFWGLVCGDWNGEEEDRSEGRDGNGEVEIVPVSSVMDAICIVCTF